MTARYAHLAPDHLRAEMAKTERPAGERFSATSAHGAPAEELSSVSLGNLATAI
jgi:hypothetical protein